MEKVLIDGIEHADTRDIRTKIFDDAWRPPTKQSELPNQKELDAISAKMAKDKWEAEYYNPATPIDRKEFMRLQKQQDQFLDAREREQQVKAHTESPRIAKRLAEAKAIRAGIVKDPERTVAEILKADRIIQTLSLPEGDHAVADAMLAELRETENEYRIIKASVFRKAADEAERKFREVMSGIVDGTKPERIRVAGHDAIERIDSLAERMADDPGYSSEDLDTVQKARRAAVLQGDTKLAEAALARFADLSPEVDQSGLEVTTNE